MPTQPDAPRKDAYLLFCRQIDQDAVQRFLRIISGCQADNFTHAHVLFQSIGGMVGEGIALYNFLKTAPIDITLYNVGAVQSIATIAFLGAKNRIANKHSIFMLHGVTSPAWAMTQGRLAAAAKSVSIDDTRIENILAEHVTLSVEDRSKLRNYELWFTAEDALKSGISNATGDFSPPFGSRLYEI